MGERKSLYLVDGSTYIFRAFYAIRHLSNSQGFPTNAIYGFTSMLLKLIRAEEPDYLAVVFDAARRSFRHDVYPEYKAHRPPAPEDLVPQFPLIREVTRAFNIPAIEREDYEADDLIGTLATTFRDVCDVTVVTSDKDLMQLVGPGVSMLDTMKDKRYQTAEVFEKMGVRPDQIIDYLALMGDKSDNIPGVPGVGKKRAADLLATHGSLKGIYQALVGGDPTLKGKLRENLENNKELADLSYYLATVKCDVPIETALEDLRRQDPDRPALGALFTKLEFKAWAREFGVQTQTALDFSAPPAPSRPSINLQRDGHELVISHQTFSAMCEALKAADTIAFHIETNSRHPITSKPLGMAFATDIAHAWYVPLGHTTLEAIGQLPVSEVMATIGPILSDPNRKIAVSDSKFARHVLARHGVTLGKVHFDPTLASYLLDPDQGPHTIDKISAAHLGHPLAEEKELLGTGRNKLVFSEVGLNQARDYTCDRVQATLALEQVLIPQLAEEKLTDLLEGIEQPLAQILSQMEATGVKVDTAALSRLSDDFGARAKALELRCHELAGRVFGVGSPKQLGVVLFEEMGLPAKKRTKTGYSTDSSVLEELSEQHPLPECVLEWRRLTKLKSTYTDQLPNLIVPETQRIHTTFGQTVAATGRLSSIDPNLQNIPIRTEDGRLIRKCFIPETSRVLMAADYSQIELRLLAHLCGSQAMQQAFAEGADIHSRTASEVFGVPENEVSRDQRNMAKTVNFGILYGMSAWRLAREQGISRNEAKGVIERYFDRYPDIERWKAETLENAREQGEVRTVMGRLRKVPGLHSRNRQLRAFSERIAINTPIQGSAADIIKAAMIAVHEALKDRSDVRMCLQVHDELLFECEPDVTSMIQDIVSEKMQNVVQLTVPLAVNVAFGNNWLEAH